MIITYTMTAVWGVLCLGLMYKICRSAIAHEMSRHHDKKLRAENIHIIRGKLRNIILAGFVALIFPVAMFLTHLLGDMGFHLFYDIAAFCAMCMAICFFYGPVEDYTEISPEGIERGESFLDTVFYPLNAIGAVSYSQASDSDESDSVTFKTESGKTITNFSPGDDGYYLLAMTRFRIENDRWPDMNNPEEAAQVKAWMNWSSTIPHIKDKEITGLAEVDM